MKYIVEESGKRLDAYITSIDSEITRTAAQRLIEQGNILVNGEKKKTAYKVSNGDIITIEKEEPKTTNNNHQRKYHNKGKKNSGKGKR